jgi:molybdopterin-guanine dinucleotide biosynthesis protein A
VQLAGIVLCGGASARMGRSKVWLDFGGETLLARTLRVVAAECDPVYVVAAPGQELPPLPGGVAVVRDPVAGLGPVQGIATGLGALAPSVTHAFVGATDAPFLHAGLIRRLAALSGADDDATVPRVAGRVHGLAAVYAAGTRSELSASLAAGTLRLRSVLERLRTRYVDEALLLADPELARTDPSLRCLRNVNTPEDYAAALAEFAAAAASEVPSDT